ncbi:hypothetical protein [Paenibacillus sp. OV219]|uniref:hypothetical protein n=1 Tax=Paenibacillus sp. OV219 TaxID=1884377 RepID=UPI0008B37C3E|nr:hypothetical protein [Paenibacillus sp. OV219]SEN28454.1 hypothetical protein SAMN05518847_102589 [Paenibacillus sp. OV219]
MPYSTGVVTNTRFFGTAASSLVVSTRNLDVINSTTVTVHIFASVSSTVFYTAYLTSYVVAANSFDVRSFSIGGNVAYEVQLNSTITNVLFTATGLDEFGNLTEDQRHPQAELIFIPVLSPVF